MTEQQNKALHLYFRLLAQELADKDFDFKSIHIPIEPTESLVKEYMWKPIQRAMFDKKSTQELTQGEVGRIYDVLHRHLVEKLDVNVQFPQEDR